MAIFTNEYPVPVTSTQGEPVWITGSVDAHVPATQSVQFLTSSVHTASIANWPAYALETTLLNVSSTIVSSQNVLSSTLAQVDVNVSGYIANNTTVVSATSEAIRNNLSGTIHNANLEASATLEAIRNNLSGAIASSTNVLSATIDSSTKQTSGTLHQVEVELSSTMVSSAIFLSSSIAGGILQLSGILSTSLAPLSQTMHQVYVDSSGVWNAVYVATSGNQEAIRNNLSQTIHFSTQETSATLEAIHLASSGTWHQIYIDTSSTIESVRSQTSATQHAVEQELSSTMESIHLQSSGTWNAVYLQTSGVLEAVRGNLSSTIGTAEKELSGTMGVVEQELSATMESIHLQSSGTWHQIYIDTSSTLGTVEQELSSTMESIHLQSSGTWHQIYADSSATWHQVYLDTSSTMGTVEQELSSTLESIHLQSSGTWHVIEQELSATMESVRAQTSATQHQVEQELSATMESIHLQSSGTWHQIYIDTSSTMGTVEQELSATAESIHLQSSGTWHQIYIDTSSTMNNVYLQSSATWEAIRTNLSQTAHQVYVDTSSTVESIHLQSSGTWHQIYVDTSSTSEAIRNNLSQTLYQFDQHLSTSLDQRFGFKGQKNQSGSAPVVIANDQTTIPMTLSGTAYTTDISSDHRLFVESEGRNIFTWDGQRGPTTRLQQGYLTGSNNIAPSVELGSSETDWHCGGYGGGTGIHQYGFVKTLPHFQRRGAATLKIEMLVSPDHTAIPDAGRVHGLGGTSYWGWFEPDVLGWNGGSYSGVESRTAGGFCFHYVSGVVDYGYINSISAATTWPSVDFVSLGSVSSSLLTGTFTGSEWTNNFNSYEIRADIHGVSYYTAGQYLGNIAWRDLPTGTTQPSLVLTQYTGTGGMNNGSWPVSLLTYVNNSFNVSPVIATVARVAYAGVSVFDGANQIAGASGTNYVEVDASGAMLITGTVGVQPIFSDLLLLASGTGNTSYTTPNPMTATFGDTLFVQACGAGSGVVTVNWSMDGVYYATGRTYNLDVSLNELIDVPVRGKYYTLVYTGSVQGPQFRLYAGMKSTAINQDVTSGNGWVTGTVHLDNATIDIGTITAPVRVTSTQAAPVWVTGSVIASGITISGTVTVSGSSPNVGTIGDPAPNQAAVDGGYDYSNTLQPLYIVDKKLLVAISSSIVLPVSSTNVVSATLMGITSATLVNQSPLTVTSTIAAPIWITGTTTTAVSFPAGFNVNVTGSTTVLSATVVGLVTSTFVPASSSVSALTAMYDPGLGTVSLAGDNLARRSFSVFNESNASIYLSISQYNASPTNYTVILGPYQLYEPANINWVGPISFLPVISGSGKIMLTEFTV